MSIEKPQLFAWATATGRTVLHFIQDDLFFYWIPLSCQRRLSLLPIGQLASAERASASRAKELIRVVLGWIRGGTISMGCRRASFAALKGAAAR